MIPEFALRLICGLSTIWCLSPRSQITSGFFRIQMLITLGLGVLLMLTSGQLPVKGYENSTAYFYTGLFVAALSYIGSMMWTLERRQAGIVFAIAIAGCSLMAILIDEFLTHSQTQDRLLAIVDSLSAAFLYGACTATMLLGHWYLTATGMSLAPLIRMNKFLLASVVVRAIVAAIQWRLCTAEQSSQWMLLTLRWAGLIGPFVLAILTIRILRYRNTQSATGVLYAATILVFMGEMAARLITQSSPS